MDRTMLDMPLLDMPLPHMPCWWPVAAEAGSRRYCTLQSS